MKKWDMSLMKGILYKYIFPAILILYPFRHIHWGLDLWDVGYNYANFRYMSLEHMDSMWYFATYLANVVGHFFTLLPGGHSLLGMNFYTGIFVSILAILAYGFCVKKLQMSPLPVFVGVFTAVSLCWCPTALVYNYLTYVLFLAGLILLYEGLTKEKNILLVLAGVCLGTNVFVRFANIPEAALIVAVWVYGIICKKKFKKVAQETGFCLLGYAGTVVLWLIYFAVRYGLSDYVSGVMRLFAMTESATDYKATSMIYGIFLGFRNNFHWFSRMCMLMVVGIVLCAIIPPTWKKIKWILCAMLAGVTAFWLYSKGFCNMHFDEYNAMICPGIVFLMLTMLICGIRILQKDVKNGEKLLAGLIVLQILLVPIGSNNGLYPSVNNLFLAVPYVLGMTCRFLKSKATVRIGESLEFEMISVKTMLVMFVALFLFQSIGFGTGFTYVEATGAKNMDTKVENNEILAGVYMSEERAEWMREISEYVETEELAGKEVILYGDIPSLSFYLGMPSAFNPWSDLRSYSEASMANAMDELEEEIKDGKNPPVVILNVKHAVYVSGGTEAMLEEGYLQYEADKIMADKKFGLIVAYMEKYGLEACFSNDRFVLYQMPEEK